MSVRKLLHNCIEFDLAAGTYRQNRVHTAGWQVGRHGDATVSLDAPVVIKVSALDHILGSDIEVGVTRGRRRSFYHWIASVSWLDATQPAAHRMQPCWEQADALAAVDELAAMLGVPALAVRRIAQPQSSAASRAS